MSSVNSDVASTAVAVADPPEPRPRRRRSTNDQTAAGWLFITPVLVILGVFLVAPIFMALWVSVSDWTGRGSPFSGNVSFIGTENYQAVLTEGGLSTRDFGTALRNNVYYVLGVVPVQTIVALVLAVLVSQRVLRFKGIYRTAFYFPSVTSSVAITVLWMFLFSSPAWSTRCSPGSRSRDPTGLTIPAESCTFSWGCSAWIKPPQPSPAPDLSDSRGGTGSPAPPSPCPR